MKDLRVTTGRMSYHHPQTKRGKRRERLLEPKNSEAGEGMGS